MSVASFRLSGGLSPGAAIAVVDLLGDVDAALAALNIRPVAQGRSALRDIPSVDTVVIARPRADFALMFPHAGRVINARVVAALQSAGLNEHTDDSPLALFPESADIHEARALVALTRAASPAATDLLLDQPRRWRLAESDPALELPSADNALLNRLITPPLVVAWGRPNIGKSSLLNALAGRSLATVADEPGTTRDHVGALLDLGGLVVRYADTPGVDDASAASSETPLARAQALAARVLAQADLVLVCTDPTSTPPRGLPAHAPQLRVGLRRDLGPSPVPVDIEVATPPGSPPRGLDDLARAVRSMLIPDRLWTDPRAWRFWDAR